jgi:AAA+ ATPase superfamily predicted ATPase
MFIGRAKELQQLKDLFSKTGPSLVVCRGRRRIGKSTLIETFGKTAPRYLQFQGLAPRENIQASDQLAAFSEQLSKQTGLPKLTLESWSQVFTVLANQIGNEKTVVLLDEISWMAMDSPDFAGYLKIAWDMEFKKKSRLVLVLCGSVSSWIEKNILNHTGFVGRISLTITLGDLALPACNAFWLKNKDRISYREKLKVLAVTGGVPRYLEEIRPSLSAEDNIRRLCFTKEGLLFNEFDQIFHDVFSRRSETYKKIVTILSNGSRERKEISDGIEWERGGNLTGYLRDLEISGFISHDTVSGIKEGKPTRLVRYRLSDNYLRFYLKCIAPHSRNIKIGLYDTAPLDEIIPWETIIGFQFESLILKNLQGLFPHIGIQSAVVKSASPYFQRTTNRQKGCQIDLLIQTKHCVYLCEMKSGVFVGIETISEVKEKMKRIAVPRGTSMRIVLIHAGDIDSKVLQAGFFDCIVTFQDLLMDTIN